jgi:hypothetical protein
MENPGQAGQKISQKDHFNFSAKDILILVEKLLELLPSDDVPANIKGKG